MSADLYLMSLAQQDAAEGCDSSSKRATLTRKLVTDLDNALKDAQARIERLTEYEPSTTRQDALFALQAQIKELRTEVLNTSDALAAMSAPTWG